VSICQLWVTTQCDLSGLVNCEFLAKTGISGHVPSQTSTWSLGNVAITEHVLASNYVGTALASQIVEWPSLVRVRLGTITLGSPGGSEPSSDHDNKNTAKYHAAAEPVPRNIWITVTGVSRNEIRDGTAELASYVCVLPISIVSVLLRSSSWTGLVSSCPWTVMLMLIERRRHNGIYICPCIVASGSLRELLDTSGSLRERMQLSDQNPRVLKFQGILDWCRGLQGKLVTETKNLIELRTSGDNRESI